MIVCEPERSSAAVRTVDAGIIIVVPEALDPALRALCDAPGITRTTSGCQALALTTAAVKLIIVATPLPDMADSDFLRALRKVNRSVPVLVVAITGVNASLVDVAIAKEVTTWQSQAVDSETATTAELHSAVPSIQTDISEGEIENDLIRTAVATLRSQYRDDGLNSRIVAERLGVSHEHFCRLFRRHTGATFSCVLREVRLQRARALLVATSLRVKEIAAEAGYSSTSHLDRDFRRRFKLAPREFRARLRRSNAGTASRGVTSRVTNGGAETALEEMDNVEVRNARARPEANALDSLREDR